MRVAIIGGGFGVSGHLPAFQAVQGVEVVALADSGSGRIKSALPQGVRYAASWQEALSLPVDAISIATPPLQQYEIVMAALAQGKHVFCEKPFGLNAAEAMGMYLAAQAAPECITAVNYQYRYEAGIVALKKNTSAGLIGPIHTIDFSWITGGRANPQSPWSWRNDASVGGGVLAAFFSHVADLLSWLTLSEPLSISGESAILVAERTDEQGARRAVTAEDFVTAQLELSGDITATCQVTNCQPGGKGMRIEIKGRDGVLIYQHIPPFAPSDCSLVYVSNTGETSSLPIAQEAIASVLDTRLPAVHKCVELFARKAMGDEYAAPPGLADALRAHHVMSALHSSIASGQACAIPRLPG